MNWSKTTKYICRHIDNANRNFYGRIIVTIIVIIIIDPSNLSLNNIFRPMCEDGLGIMKDISVAYLAKYGWIVLSQSGNIWVQLVEAKYFNNNDS